MVRAKKPLPESAELVGRMILDMAPVSTGELRTALYLSDDEVSDGLRHLKGRKMVDGAEMSCLLPAVHRWWLTALGLDYFGASEEQRSWHRPAGLSRLIYMDLLRVEAVNSIAILYPAEDRKLARIQRYGRDPMCAVAEYRSSNESPATLVFCWVPMLESPQELYRRLEALPESMQALTVDAETEYRPGGLCLVADDEWDASQALTMACAILSRWVPPASITAWYYTGGGWRVSTGKSVLNGEPPSELPPLRPPVNALRPVASKGRLRGLSLKKAIETWAGRRGQTLFRLQTSLGMYPAISLSHLQAFAGEPPEGKDTNRRLRGLVKLRRAKVAAESVRNKAKGSGKGRPLGIARRGHYGLRYDLTGAGRSNFTLGHEGSPPQLASRTEIRNIAAETWPDVHRGIEYELQAHFKEKEGGCSVAPWWRTRITLSNGETINPDGVVLVRAPWGRSWNYLEVELSHDGPTAVEERCGRYGSPNRLDGYGLLVVGASDRAERNFREAGLQCSPPLKMLTTTLRRLKKGGGVFGAGVWSHYGTATSLFPPDVAP